jgi:hypothetical protein
MHGLILLTSFCRAQVCLFADKLTSIQIDTDTHSASGVRHMVACSDGLGFVRPRRYNWMTGIVQYG